MHAYVPSTFIDHTHAVAALVIADQPDSEALCRDIYGDELILAQQRPGQRINILTHCNAGWLATVDWGTATSPIYQAFNAGLDVHVWVDETRPRNQGASLPGSWASTVGAHPDRR